MPTITYQIWVATKNPFQPWRLLPPEEGATAGNPRPVASIFYDTAKDNDGFGCKASDFSGKQGFEIRSRLVAEISEGPTDTHTTDYIYESPAGTILDNGDQTDDTITWTAVSTIVDSLGNTLPSGYLKLNDVMTMTTVFTVTNGDTGDYHEMWSINRLYKVNGGVVDIEEFSSIRDNRTDGVFQPIASMATNHLEVVYTDATHVTTRCLIDGRKLVPGTDYIFSRRIDYTPI